MLFPLYFFDIVVIFLHSFFVTKGFGNNFAKAVLTLFKLAVASLNKRWKQVLPCLFVGYVWGKRLYEYLVEQCGYNIRIMRLQNIVLTNCSFV